MPQTTLMPLKVCGATDCLHAFKGKCVVPQTICMPLKVCLFVLRFYSPVNPMGSCRARSVYLTTRLLDRLSPLSG